MTGTLTRLREHSSGSRGDSSRLATDAATPSTIALLPIAADLLPRVSSTSGRDRVGRIVALVVVVVALVATAGWYLLAARTTAAATDDLQRAQDRETSLMARQHQFDDLVQTQHLTSTIRDQLAPLMAGDVPWATTLQAVSDAAGNIGFTSITGSVPTTNADDSPAATDGADATIGTLSISGFADTKPLIADFVDAVAATPGLANPFLTDVNENSETHLFSFTLTVDVTGAIRGDTPARWTDTASPDGVAK